MKNPAAFTVLVIAVLLCAGAATYFGLPLLDSAHMSCRVGGGRTEGCSTSFGAFFTYLIAVIAVAIGVIWSRFGRN